MTIRQHLETLQEPYRTQALANMWWELAEQHTPTLSRALHTAFNWYRSPEGIKYWAALQETIIKQENRKQL